MIFNRTTEERATEIVNEMEDSGIIFEENRLKEYFISSIAIHMQEYFEENFDIENSFDEDIY